MAENPNENPEQKPEEEPLPLDKYLELEKDEILSETNAYFTGLAVYHPPTKEEMEMHYALNGGAEDFAKKHILKARVEKNPEDGEKENVTKP